MALSAESGAPGLERGWSVDAYGRRYYRRMQRQAGARRDSPDSTRNATADRAMDLLLLFNEERTALTVAEMSAELGMSRSTTYRYVQSLRSYGFLEDDEPRGFRLGPMIFELSRVARHGLGLSEVAIPVMRRLADSLRATTLLTRRYADKVVTIEREDSPSPIRISYERGHVLPLHAGASGRVFLAYLQPDQLDEFLGDQPLQRFTKSTITSRRELQRTLDQTRTDGYTVSHGELDEGVLGVAAPIFGSDGSVVAALSLVDTEFSVDAARLKRMVRAVVDGAGEIGSRVRSLGL